jgi:hypothetical protein
MRRVVFAAFLAALLAPLPAAAGSIITLSTASSDETPAADLDATFDFSVASSTLTLVVTNTTTSPTFNINEIYFNALDTSSVTGLTLTSAMHSDTNAGAGNDGNVMADWGMGMPPGVKTNIQADGFGVFDFGLTDMMGETDPSTIGPSEYVTFTFTIGGTEPFASSDFIAPSSLGYTAAAKFVNGPSDDSAYGAVPEPSTALLLAFGLVGLATGRRRKTR